MPNEKIIQVSYARLKGLRQNLPEGEIHRELIDDFHDIVAILENLGGDLSAFMIPDREILVSEHMAHSCDPHLFRAKLDGLLKLFQVSADEGNVELLPLEE